MTPSAYALPEITQAIRDALPDTLIVLGGAHVAAFGRAALADTAADVAVVGEGELTMEQIVRAFLEREGMECIAGIIRRDLNGNIVVNSGVQPLIKDLDSLPMPAYDLIDMSKYWSQQAFAPVPSRRYVSLFSSRGCPYGCIYCHNVFGKGFRAQSPERIIAEIKYVRKLTSAVEVEFLDDCFNLDRNRVLAYAELLLKEVGPMKTMFPNALRADLLDDEIVDALVSAGMYYSALALESGVPRIQKLIGKRLHISKFLEATALCSKRKVRHPDPD